MEILDKSISFSVDKHIFNIECVMQTSSLYTHDYYVSVNENESNIDITITNKLDESLPKNLNLDFKNKLIDQKTWIDLSNRFGEIRNKIVEQAFSSTKD